ncbi:MAG: hypothetical protein ACRCU5_07050 [Rhizobiaceae bacterium]
MDIIDKTAKKPKFEISADTRLLYQRLAQVEPGQTISYEELSAAISRKVTGGDGHLQVAIKKCRNEDDIVFENIRGNGYRRMLDEDIVDSGSQYPSRIRRVAKREIQKQSKVKDFSALSNERKIKHGLTMALAAAHHHMSGKKSVTMIGEAVKTAGHEIPIAETLKLFGKS